MCKIPPIKTKKIINLLLAHGWQERKKQSGSSHRCFTKGGCARPIVILSHKETPAYITNQILHQIGLSRSEFLNIITKY
jgi:predicted RNA binding protein YcfA (HicA-like mRNA interferase family)